MDTHVWVWLAAGHGGHFAAGVVEALENAAAAAHLWASTFSIWEIALKAEKGALLVATDLHAWVGQQQEEPGVRLLGLTPALGIDATLLPQWTRRSDGKPHRDPCDRFIVATARRRSAVLVTSDRVILDYADDGHVLALAAGG
jgi:PIN domain nuclease of toxin-antitoxin system